MEIRNGNVIFKGSRIHGMGGYAAKKIRKGTRIIEYIGEKMDKKESHRRCTDGNVYVFQITKEYDIDGSVDWNPARWINHSCDPNAETDIIDERVWIIATRTIQPGEEITYNYGFDLDEYDDYPCNCGAENCVGFIVAEEHHDKVRKAHRKQKKKSGRK